MRKSKSTEEQMVKMLRETDKNSVADVAKKHGPSTETLYKWHRKFSGMFQRNRPAMDDLSE